MTPVLLVVGAVLALLALLALGSLRSLICICSPNEVLIFSGGRRRAGKGVIGYRLVKGGRGVRLPLLERVDRMDLTNMVIELTAKNAYSKGGIPLNVQGIANIKIAGHEPVIHNAITRFLGMDRKAIMQIAKVTLEGSLRGILATMTPEQVNEDRNLFAEKLVHEVEHDMTALGLVVDTLKIQHIHDDVHYLDSIGRKKNAEMIRKARIAEAIAKADALVRAAENRELEAKTRIQAEIEMARANAEKLLADALSRRDAVVAEERATVSAQVAQATAGIDVQKARVEQVRHRLDAEVIAPARAALQAAEAAARGSAAPIIAGARAQAAALSALATSWKSAGPRAREIFLVRKLDRVIETLTSVIPTTPIEQLTMIDSRAPAPGGTGSVPFKAFSAIEQIRQVLGVDLAARLGGGGGGDGAAPSPDPATATAAAVATVDDFIRALDGGSGTVTPGATDAIMRPK